MGPESTVVSTCLNHVVWWNICLHHVSWRNLCNVCLHRVAFIYYGARSGALQAPELAEQSGLTLGSICKALGSSWSAIGTLRDGSRIDPEWSPSGSKMAPNSILESLRELLELSWQRGGLLEAT